MCLNRLSRFRPAKKGWQVKRLKHPPASNKKCYHSVYFVHEKQELGGHYQAVQERVKTDRWAWGADHTQTYLSGFHVFHRLKDAEKYMMKLGGHQLDYCIVQVECLGVKETGYQFFEYWHKGRPVSINAKVTVCGEIKILKEISYGPANKDAVV